MYGGSHKHTGLVSSSSHMKNPHCFLSLGQLKNLRPEFSTEFWPTVRKAGFCRSLQKQNSGNADCRFGFCSRDEAGMKPGLVKDKINSTNRPFLIHTFQNMLYLDLLM